VTVSKSGALAAIETGQNPRYNHNRVIIAENRAYDDIIGKPVRRTIVRGARACGAPSGCRRGRGGDLHLVCRADPEA
jgi:hypothetical protein